MASERIQRRIERLLDQIDQAEAQGEWHAMHGLAQDVLEVDPGNEEAAAYLRSAERHLAATSEGAGISPASPPPVEPTGTAPDAERRQLTVMFCDLQGSTALSQQLDPEDLRDVIRGYQEVCAGAVGRFEGHIAKYLGDGLLVYFGYPQAHEDDPQRAVRAGLAILQGMGPLNAQLRSARDLELTVRIGIHTGLVVAGEMGGGDTLEELAIVGETPNVAARIEGAAEPNGIAISDVTANLVQGFFLSESMGPHELKGIAEPVELFRVLEESGAQTRFDVAVSTHLTPLVGRDQEVGLLLDRWEQVEEGLGQVVLVSGEAGIGKSRLLQGLIDGLAGRPHVMQEHRCSPYHQNSTLFPIIESYERWLGFQRMDSPEERIQALEKALEERSLLTPEALSLWAGMLSVPLDESHPPLDISPQLQRQRTMELMAQLKVATASQEPVLAVFEDLHWADPTTLDFLGLLLEQVATTKVMVILTFRPEFTPPWGSRSHVTQINLNRLPRRLATDLMARVTGGKELPEDVVTQISAKSDGVPLFVEELTRMVLESGLLREVDGRYELTGPLTDLAIPSTLQDSLTARLDRLGEVKEVVQLASVLGREFIYQLIQAVSQEDEGPLSDHLRQLVTGEFLYQHGVLPEASYIFKHALIQDAAYNSLLISRRQQYHRLVAQIYEESFPETVESQPELVAHHYTEAGLNAEAIPHWQQAGQNAMRRSANVEGVNHFTKGLELLEHLPETAERASQEVAFQTMLGQCLIQIQGYSSPNVERAFSRARELMDQIGETPQYFQVTYGLFTYYLIRAELQSALQVAEECLEAAQRSEDPYPVVMAHRNIGSAMMFMGNQASAREHLEQGISHYELSEHRTLALRYGQEPTCTARAFYARNLWLLGFPDQALIQIQKALELAQEVSHPFTLAAIQSFTAMFYFDTRAFQSALHYAEATVELSQEQRFAFWAAVGSQILGACWAQQGRTSEGIESIIAGSTSAARMGGMLNQSVGMVYLAESHLISGRAEDGLQAWSERFALLPDGGSAWEAEVHRLKGELLLLPGGSDIEAEESFNQALDVARKQSARSLELRSSMCLARLWRKQGKQTDARELLAEIYGWFTEGFDTPDLIDAKALLEELS
ncbi:MAG: AAA family ATPase [Chloroflexi bacterium]|nr:AAA family ATPase [Chloroflexota bacterium]